MDTYQRVFHLIDQNINSTKNRAILSPLLTFIELYEKERITDLREKAFSHLCESQLQWFYFSDDYYGGVGEWHEFPPLCASQLNKALRENKSSAQVSLAQRNYLIDFNEMTKRLLTENQSLHHGPSTVSIFAKAKLKEEFSIDKLRMIEDKINAAQRHHFLLLQAILKLLRSSMTDPLDPELACNSLRLLLRLVSLNGMAEKFIEEGGVQLLLQLQLLEHSPNAQVFPNTNELSMQIAIRPVIVALILRHCVDSDKGVLENAFEQMLRNTCTGQPISHLETTSRRHALRAKRYQKDWKRVFRLLAPLAVRSPLLYMEIIKNSVNIKNNEIQFKLEGKPKEADQSSTPYSNNLKIVLDSLIQQLASFGETSMTKIGQKHVFHPENLLKFISELLRSYSAAPAYLMEIKIDDKSVTKWLIEKYIIDCGATADASSETTFAAKAVISSLISNAKSLAITDQIVEDIKSTLRAIFVEYTNKTPIERNKWTMTYSGKIATLAKLTTALLTEQGQNNIAEPSTPPKINKLLVKSIYSRDLTNDFVKSIWAISLHDKQGSDAVNTLLKFLEGIATREVVCGLNASSENGTEGPKPQQGTSEMDSGGQPPNMDVDGSSGSNAPQIMLSAAHGADGDETQSLGGRSSHEDEVMAMAMMDADQSREEDDEPAQHEHEDEIHDDPDDGEDNDSEDMDTAQAMHHQAMADEAEEMMEGASDGERDMQNATMHANHPQNLLAEETADDMDDDDDDDEDEEEEAEDNDENLIEFEEFADYLNVAEFAHFANEINSIRQDLHRINMNISANLSNTMGTPNFPQALMQQLPRNVRSLFSHHPRGGAVLRIRDTPINIVRNLIELDGLDVNRVGANNAGRDSFVSQFLNTMAGYGPLRATNNEATELALQQSIPSFLDRLAELVRILEPLSVFYYGTMLASYLVTEIEVKNEVVPPKEKEETAAAAEDETKMEAEPQIAVDTTATDTQPTMMAQTTSNANQIAEESSQQHTDEQRLGEGEIQEQEPSPMLTQPEPAESGGVESTNQIGEDNDGSNVEQQPGANAEQPTAPIPEQPAVAQQDANLPEGVDPAFLAALPEDMRQEVIRDHLIQQHLNAPTGPDRDLPAERIAAIADMEVPEGMDPAFLAALPEDIFHEVVRDHQHQQELARQRQQRTALTAQLRNEQQRMAAGGFSGHHRISRFPGHHRMAIRGDPRFAHRETTILFGDQQALQLLDRESILTLLLLLFLDQERINIARLQKLLKVACLHPGTCDFVVWSLLYLLEGLDKFDALEQNGIEKLQGWVNNLPLQSALDQNERIIRITQFSVQVNEQIRSSSAHHVVDMLNSLTASFSSRFLPKTSKFSANDPPMSRDQFWELMRSINSNGVELLCPSECIRPILPLQEIGIETLENSPFGYVMKMTNSNLSKNNQTFMDKQLKIVLTISKTLSSEFYQKMSADTKRWLGDCLKDLTTTMLERCTDEALKDGRALLVELLRIAPSQRTLILAALHDGLRKHGLELQEQLRTLKNVLNSPRENKGISAVPNSLLLADTLKKFSGKESTPKKLLKSLETMSYLDNQLKKIDQQQLKTTKTETDKEKEKEENEKTAAGTSADQTQEEAAAGGEQDRFQQLKATMVDELQPLWKELSSCLDALDKMKDTQHAILSLQNAAEAFFLCYSLVIPSNSVNEQNDRPMAAASPPSSSNAVGILTNHQKDMFNFAEKHRSVLNQILRGNTQNLENSAFAILMHFPKLLDFDVKRKYFYKELKKLDYRNRYRHEDIAIRVRRTHIFGDSFRELYRLRPVDWKARFYIIFEGEEGQDAGGLLREWYSIITREIFNPNYALFINAPGDRVTYMINKTSYVNPEHLDYFKFVGRVIAKAIYDNKQLDCFFTRAFYKHILNIHVRYQDIESEDPEIFKSLEFLLNNSIEDLGSELSFSVEVEEFGVRSTRQLKEDGSKTLVTDVNKQEYVHLMCQMKMTGSIRQQLNAFLEGFYEVIPKTLISIFNEQELELLISGLPEIDLDDLCTNTEYKNYTRSSPQIQWFWRALRSFDQEDKAKFLQFVTGTSKVPLQGFAHLEGMNGLQKFTIQKDTRSNDRLPSAHTCFNQLDLPEYPDYEAMHKMLLLASRECSEGFAFA